MRRRIDFYAGKNWWKALLLIAGLAIVAFSLLYTGNLARRISAEEQRDITLWAQALQRILSAAGEQDLTFESQVLEYNTSIPSILVDESGMIQDARNLAPADSKPSDSYLQSRLAKMKKGYAPITIKNEFIGTQYLYYDNSATYRAIRWFPLVQLGLILLFIAIGYYAFSSARRAEQNQVWVGMSKETAHQLGTPISSVMAWADYLSHTEKEEMNPAMVAQELSKDAEKLQIVAERFSKIGANPELTPVDIVGVVNATLAYIRPRSPRKVTFYFSDEQSEPVWVRGHALLLEWVLENLLKNALDAMDGNGSVQLELLYNTRTATLEITDTGKGIPRSRFTRVFQPGYTTKQRGWGLGLSLARRIIEQYHRGRIFVKDSELGKGTTFALQLRRISPPQGEAV